MEGNENKQPKIADDSWTSTDVTQNHLFMGGQHIMKILKQMLMFMFMLYEMLLTEVTEISRKCVIN